MLTAVGRGTCDTSPSHTWSVSVYHWRSCPVLWQRLQGAGLLHQKRWQLIHHPALSHHLHWVERASQDEAGLLDKFIESHSCCQDAAAPADYSIENGWCHHRVIDCCQECSLHSKGPEVLQQQVTVRCHHLNVRSLDLHLRAGLSVPAEIHHRLFGLPSVELKDGSAGIKDMSIFLLLIWWLNRSIHIQDIINI